MAGISVIMASYLGPYPGSRFNPEEKFIRAVKSFQQQTHLEKELVIVSDGCEITNGLYQAYFKQDPDITLVQCEKRKGTWPGELREAGRSLARYDWITYLDSDDVILENHLKIISKKISELHESERLMFNSRMHIPLPEDPSDLFLNFLGLDIQSYLKITKSIKDVKLLGKIGSIKAIGHNGTWQITHHKLVPVRWENSNTFGEDTYFIKRLKMVENWQEYMGQYLICHCGVANNRSKIVWEI